MMIARDHQVSKEGMSTRETKRGGQEEKGGVRDEPNMVVVRKATSAAEGSQSGRLRLCRSGNIKQ